MDGMEASDTLDGWANGSVLDSLPAEGSVSPEKVRTPKQRPHKATQSAGGGTPGGAARAADAQPFRASRSAQPHPKSGQDHGNMKAKRSRKATKLGNRKTAAGRRVAARPRRSEGNAAQRAHELDRGRARDGGLDQEGSLLEPYAQSFASDDDVREGDSDGEEMQRSSSVGSRLGQASSYLELGRQVVEERQRKLLWSGGVDPVNMPPSAMTLDRISAEVGTIPVGDVGIGTVVFGNGPSSPVGGPNVAQLHRRVRTIVRNRTKPKHARKAKPAPSRPDFDLDVRPNQASVRQQSVNFSGIDGKPEVPKPKVEALKNAVAARSAAILADMEDRIHKANTFRQSVYEADNEKRRQFRQKQLDWLTYPPPSALVAEERSAKVAADLEKKDEQAQTIRTSVAQHEKAMREWLKSPGSPKPTSPLFEYDGMATAKPSFQSDGSPIREDRLPHTASQLAEESTIDRPHGKAVDLVSSVDDVGSRRPPSQGQVLFEFDGTTKRQTGVPAKQKQPFKSARSKAKTRRKQHNARKTSKSMGRKQSKSSPYLGSGPNVQNYLPPNAHPDLISASEAQAGGTAAAVAASVKSGTSFGSEASQYLVSVDTMLDGQLRRIRSENRLGKSLFYDVGSTFASAPSFSLSSRQKTEEEFQIASGYASVPGPGAYDTVASFTSENKTRSRGVEFGHRSQSDMPRPPGLDGPGPGGSGKPPSFVYDAKLERKGVTIKSRLPDAREMMRRARYPETPAPGGTYEIPGFAEESMRHGRGIPFIDSRPPTELDKLMEKGKRDRRVLPVGPGGEAPVKGMAEENKAAQRGAALGMRTKTPRTMRRDVGLDVAPGPGGSFGHQPTSFTRQVMRDTTGFAMGGRAKDEFTSNERTGKPVDPGSGQYNVEAAEFLVLPKAPSLARTLRGPKKRSPKREDHPGRAELTGFVTDGSRLVTGLGLN